jgi:hypothetical protein
MTTNALRQRRFLREKERKIKLPASRALPKFRLSNGGGEAGRYPISIADPSGKQLIQTTARSHDGNRSKVSSICGARARMTPRLRVERCEGMVFVINEINRLQRS